MTAPPKALLSIIVIAGFGLSAFGVAQNSNQHNPTWWNKYQYIANNGPGGGGAATSSLSVGSNVDVSNECGPQSETFITLDPSRPPTLAGRVNENFPPPLRGGFFFHAGASPGGVGLASPAPHRRHWGDLG